MTVLTEVFARWEEVVGAEVAAHAEPRSLRDGVLVIAVDQPAWATQLRFLGADLLARVRDATGCSRCRRNSGEGGRRARPAAARRKALLSVRNGRSRHTPLVDYKYREFGLLTCTFPLSLAPEMS